MEDKEIIKRFLNDERFIHLRDFITRGNLSNGEHSYMSDLLRIAQMRDCNWNFPDWMISDRDVWNAVYEFLHITSDGEDKYQHRVFERRNDLISSYCDLMSKTVTLESIGFEKIEKHVRDEITLFKILTYFGVASVDDKDEDEKVFILNMEKRFKDFSNLSSQKLEQSDDRLKSLFNQIKTTFNLSRFSFPFTLYRKLRNFASHEVHSEVMPGVIWFEDLDSVMISHILEFHIYFFIGLTLLLRKAWERERIEREISRLKPDYCSRLHEYDGNNVLERQVPLPLSDFDLKIVPEGERIGKVNIVREGKTFELTIGDADDGVFCVKGISEKVGLYEPFDIIVGYSTTGKVTYPCQLTIEKRYVEITRSKGVKILVEPMLHTVPLPKQVEPEKDKERNNHKWKIIPSSERKVERDENGYAKLFEAITEDGRTVLCKWIPSYLGGSQRNSYILLGIKERINPRRIILPNYLINSEDILSVCMELDYIANSFFQEYKSLGGGILVVPNDARTEYDLPDNIEIVQKKDWRDGEVFGYEANGVVFKCRYRKRDFEKKDSYGECSIVGMDNNDEDRIVVPEYACGLLVTAIEEKAFMDVPASEILLPNSIDTIGKEAFAGSSIWRIRIPEQVHVISERLFEDCCNLQVVELDGDIHCIGRFAFRGCESLVSCKKRSDVVSLMKDEDIHDGWPVSICLEGRGNHNTDYSIQEGTFAGCKSIEKVFLDVVRIGKHAFWGCENLREIQSTGRINDDSFFIDEIGEAAFGNCPNLQQIFGVERASFKKEYESKPNRRRLKNVFGTKMTFGNLLRTLIEED